MVKQGDRVRVQGREATVVSQWCQGRHTVWSLDDGTTVRDLEKKVEDGSAELLSTPKYQPEPERAFERLPVDEEDFEE